MTESCKLNNAIWNSRQNSAIPHFTVGPYLKPILRVHTWAHKTQLISYSMQQANRDNHIYILLAT